MKAVCIIGSPRKRGNTSFLMDMVIEGMSEYQIAATQYYLGDLNIGFCSGCKQCHLTGNCVQNDDVNDIIKSIDESDIVVIGSPSYWGDITGQLKVFFDRCTPYSDTNPNREFIPKDKIGVSIAVRTGNSERENIHIIDTIEHYFGHMQIEPFAKLSICGVTDVNDLIHKEDEVNNAYDIGVQIGDWSRGKIV